MGKHQRGQDISHEHSRGVLFGPQSGRTSGKFWLDDAVLFIESIQDQWKSPGTQYFRVRADDGNTYVLGHHEGNDAWALESFRLEEQGVVTTGDSE